MKDSLAGLQAGMETNFKRLVAGELDKDADNRNDLAVLNKIFVLNAGRMMNAAGDSVEDLLQARKRKEIKGEHRDEELEEQLARSTNMETQQSSGVNAQMGGINEVITTAVNGAIQELIAAGKLKWA